MSPPPVNANGRTVKPNGELCKSLRLQKVGDVAAMAARSGLTKKTVQSVESGRRCFVLTLQAFGDVLDLDDISQLLEDPYSLPPPIAGGNRVQLKLKFVLPYAECDFTEWLIRIVNVIIKVIDPMGEIEVIAIAPGSVIVTLEMNASDAKKTVSAFGSGELNNLSLGSITTNFGYGALQEFNAIPAPAETIIGLFHRLRMQPQPPQGEPAGKSLWQRFTVWFFGTPGQTSDPPPYRDSAQRSSIFDRFKQNR